MAKHKKVCGPKRDNTLMEIQGLGTTKMRPILGLIMKGKSQKSYTQAENEEMF